MTKPPNAPTCPGPGCSRPAWRTGLCAAHYMQRRRGNALTPLRTDDNTAQVTFRCPAELKHAVERDAKRQDIEPAEWWRRAGRRLLKNT